MKWYKQYREKRKSEECDINKEEKERKYADVENHIYFLVVREPLWA
jgi:hypothetical protein